MIVAPGPFPTPRLRHYDGPMAERKESKSIMHSLGAFFGHVVRGVKTPPGGSPMKKEVRREVETQTQETPQGRVTLRRTTIEEVEMHPPE